VARWWRAGLWAGHLSVKHSSLANTLCDLWQVAEPPLASVSTYLPGFVRTDWDNACRAPSCDLSRVIFNGRLDHWWQKGHARTSGCSICLPQLSGQAVKPVKSFHSLELHIVNLPMISNADTIDKRMESHPGLC
jgi:hypothetical protein